MTNENLRKTLQLAFATVAATLVHQQMKIANLENILLSHGMAQESDFAVAGLRREARIDEMMRPPVPGAGRISRTCLRMYSGAGPS